MEKEDKLGSEAKSNDSSSSSNNNNREVEKEEKPNSNLGSSADDNGEEEEDTQAPCQSSSRRTPFSNLSQVDADLALARTLQEQERAYMMLRFNSNEGSDYGSWEAANYLHHDVDEDDDDDFGDPDDEEDDDDSDDNEVDDEDAFDVHGHDTVSGAAVDLDSSMFSSDEAYARALQDAEEREMAARLLAFAGLNDEVEDANHQAGNSQDAWEEVDPDDLSYEELIALGEVVGSESRGLSADTIASLPSVNYKAGSSQNGSTDACVICRLDYEDGETLTLLSCKHSYHPECINNWLKINKVCPVCSSEVSTSGHS